MRGLALVIVLIMTSAALAGCTASDENAKNEVNTPASVDAGSGKGAIAVVTMDPESAIVSGVTVGIKGTDLEGRTDDTGAFAFNGLEPGEYVVLAQRLGYEPASASATVLDGQIVDLVITVTPLAVLVPHYETVSATGVIGCAVSTPAITVITCYGDVDHDPFLDFNATRGVRYTLTEITWDANSATTGKELLANSYVDDVYTGRTAGPSPLIIVHDDFPELEDDEVVDIEHTMFVNFFSQSNPTPVAYEQPFTGYFTVFYDMDIPEGFSALPPS